MCIRASEGIQFRTLIFVRRFWAGAKATLNEAISKLLWQQPSGGTTISRGEGREIKEKKPMQYNIGTKIFCLGGMSCT